MSSLAGLAYARRDSHPGHGQTDGAPIAYPDRLMSARFRGSARAFPRECPRVFVALRLGHLPGAPRGARSSSYPERARYAITERDEGGGAAQVAKITQARAAR